MRSKLIMRGSELETAKTARRVVGQRLEGMRDKAMHVDGNSDRQLSHLDGVVDRDKYRVPPGHTSVEDFAMELSDLAQAFGYLSAQIEIAERNAQR